MLHSGVDNFRNCLTAGKERERERESIKDSDRVANCKLQIL